LLLVAYDIFGNPRVINIPQSEHIAFEVRTIDSHITEKQYMKKAITTPGRRRIQCKHVGGRVEIQWTWVRILSGAEPTDPQLGEHSCTGRGQGTCPVKSSFAPGDYSLCPHFYTIVRGNQL
jgi:hypothetical protein